MKLIKSSYEIIPQEVGIEGVYKIIERVGRVSHKSEHLIKEDSAKPFVDRLINWGHNSSLEFGTVYLSFPSGHSSIHKYLNNPYSKVVVDFGKYFVTTNYRVIIDNHWEEDLRYLTSPLGHEKRICVKFICSRDISHQIVRHRKMSFLQESQRYCKYNLDKFGGLTYIIPEWCKLPSGDYNSIEDLSKMENADAVHFKLLRSLLGTERLYDELIEEGLKAEEARAILPNCTKTELYVCGYISDWEEFFKLRDDKEHADPNVYVLAHKLHEEFSKIK